MGAKIWIRRKIRRFSRISKTYHLMLWSLIVFLIFVAVGIYNFMLLPQIKLHGDKTVVLDYQEKYVEKGYQADFLGNNITDNVFVEGKVNSNKIGVYEITYTVREGVFTKKVKRKVIVKDRKKPVLKIDDSDIYLCPGDEVVPEKVRATDNYDGDLTDAVKVALKKDQITYRVRDKSGNERRVTKKIYYKDIEKPVITLKGSDYMYLFLGDEFVEPGYEVYDNCTKNIQKKVKVEGTVNTDKVGDYVLKYSVRDDNQNVSQVERKVKVSERGQNGTIYLTFDDGPNSGTTDVILDILKEEGVKATFFVTNKGPDDLIKREFDEGHTVGLHTASHDYGIVYSSVDAYFNDLYSVLDRVKRITGTESKIIRFPGGSSNTVSRRYMNGIMTTLTNEAVNRGFKYYDWNLSSGDAEGGIHSATDISNNVINNLRRDRVNMVLMHDIKTYTRDALRSIIRYGKENGYTFEQITMDTEMVCQRVNN